MGRTPPGSRTGASARRTQANRCVEHLVVEMVLSWSLTCCCEWVMRWSNMTRSRPMHRTKAELACALIDR
jgi:hypothetical protein